ncbi:7,8-didemethyl-8-hydroxy-5-deazariboflavin synthase CofG [Nocardioides alkalitolerans]|uniref:7,8-didemethyl-8-hydroxy-5-deazariboflavin synthase CofG n=1 Tax=Nocardioides alkalitolerans TaxID=281714 RepID=UPI0009FBA778|nr:7,8-didemethyl-8-hydroxy-5-deazariboflavin synthase CofG [Nocardioides alkalitolerans]
MPTAVSARPRDLTLDEVVTSLSAAGSDLTALMARAAAARDEALRRMGRPGVITWSRKVFVPVTTLCRDRCHYCVFVDTPAKLERKGVPAYLTEDRVLAIARQGAALGCKEALLTLGDRPEDRWPLARRWLDDHGFASTLDYVAHLARRITAETGLLAHHNPGVMSADELAMLRSTAPSMGMMLETTSARVFEEPGGAHFGSPDKDPRVRLAVLEDAGRARVPFTTGILVGIGETVTERAESLLALRDVHRRHGHLQEVIVQNFRAKPATAMQGALDADTEGYLAAVATARLVLDHDVRLQAPPNLSDPDDLGRLIAAGIDDWGGVSPLTADHVNPERPWPQVEALARTTAEHGFAMRERLTVHPPYVADPGRWLAPALRRPVLDVAGADGLAADGLVINGPARHGVPPRARSATARDLVERAAQEPGTLDVDDLSSLLDLDGDDLDRLCEAADELRRSVVGATITLVVNRNLGSDVMTDPAIVAAVAADAWNLGASELCIQGVADRAAPIDVYEQVTRAVKEGAPDIHLHAFRPADVVDGAHRTGRTLREQLEALREAGVDTVPGTGVKLLDESVRRRAFPSDLPVEVWTASITAAHAVGLRSTSVMFYGHGETARERASHLLRLRELQAVTRGFTEIVPMAMPGAGARDHRVVHAVARIALHGSVPHVQAAWTRLGAADLLAVLRGGADDLGGTLLDGRVRPDAGAENGRQLSVDAARGLARQLGRQLRLRSTTYADAPRPAR